MTDHLRPIDQMQDMSAAAVAAQIQRLFQMEDGRCRHPHTAPVVTAITDELVARICTACLTQLPAAWGCTNCEWIETQTLCEPVPTKLLAQPCQEHS